MMFLKPRQRFLRWLHLLETMFWYFRQGSEIHQAIDEEVQYIQSRQCIFVALVGGIGNDQDNSQETDRRIPGR